MYGHGINIAARIQGLAAPGGICVADTVHPFVRNDPECSFRSLGKQNLKNIEDEIEIFAVDFHDAHRHV